MLSSSGAVNLYGISPFSLRRRGLSSCGQEDDDDEAVKNRELSICLIALLDSIAQCLEGLLDYCKMSKYAGKYPAWRAIADGGACGRC